VDQPAVGVFCLTGAGDRAFCAGGDQKQRAETGDYGPRASGLFEIERLHRLIRDVPKPVIAAVNGVARIAHPSSGTIGRGPRASRRGR
jgi:naphthoate synthase